MLSQSADDVCAVLEHLIGDAPVMPGERYNQRAIPRDDIAALDDGLGRPAPRSGRANVPLTSHGRSRIGILAGQVSTLPVALLAGSAVLSIATGGLIDALVTLGVVALNAGIGFTSKDATERLIRKMSRPVAHDTAVISAGTLRRCSASEIVRGDVIALGPGAFVPADARMIAADHPIIALSIRALPGSGKTLGVERSAVDQSV